MTELAAAIDRASIRLNTPCAPGQRNTAINSDDLRVILSAASAAPDLLEALERIAEISVNSRLGVAQAETMQEYARTAIARAKGESA